MSRRHLLEIAALDRAEIEQLLDLAESFADISRRPIKKVPTLRGRTVVNLFLEPSTRTRTSFELAAKRLSADTLNISGSGSSVVKGETLLDTARNLAAYRPDIIVLRHDQAGAPHLLARRIDASIVNAGDGAHEHPTQALLDLYTIRRHKKRIEGLKVAIIGDIAHSRVARSNIIGLVRLGAHVTVCGPPTMIPPAIEELASPGGMRRREGGERLSAARRDDEGVVQPRRGGPTPLTADARTPQQGQLPRETPGCARTHDRAEALRDADVVMMLRIQKERLAEELFPSDREYARVYGLDPDALALAHPDALVMHPGPINRGVELDPRLADGPRSVILEQVHNGLAVRMAVLYHCAGGAGAGATA